MAKPKTRKPKKASEPKPPPLAKVGTRSGLGRVFLPLSVVVFAMLAFWPTLQNGFVDWDDDKMILENPYYRGLGWSHLHWMFSTFHMGHYQPLSWMTLGLDYLLWGTEPVGYHLTSLLIHSVNALVSYFIMLRLLRLAVNVELAASDLALRWAAWFGAMLFAIHPLRVESVAWITERRDVLSGLFFLLTILYYLKGVTPGLTAPRRRLWMFSAVFFYCLSLLSKASAITLPVVLVILDFYPLKRLRTESGAWLGPAARKVWLEKILFIPPAIGFALIALFAQSSSGALRTLDYGVGRRFAQAFYGIAFYLWKMLIPINLSPIYGIPVHLKPGDWPPLILSGVLVVALTVFLIARMNRWPALSAIWFYYLISLSPVLGFAQSGPQIVADRYSYLSCLGWAMLCGAAIFYLWQFCSRGNRGGQALVFPAAPAATVLVILGLLTWQQTQVWRDAETLWAHAVRTSPQDHWAHNFFANALVHRGMVEKGTEQYRQALQIEPDFKEAHHNLAITLATQGRLNEAIEHYRDALRIDPTYKEAHNNLGVALANRGELTEAIEQFRQALRIDPDFKNAADNLHALMPDATSN
jgi:protein O-mannosyl-transferase